MRLKTILLLLLVSSFTLRPGAAEPLPSGALPNKNDPTEHVTSEAGDPGVVLKRLIDGSTTIAPSQNVPATLRNNALFFPGESFLIKIGNVYVKDKSIEELTKLLPGAVGSTVEITLVEGDQPVTKVLTRYSQKDWHEQSDAYGPLLNIESLFTGWYGSSEEEAALGKNLHMSGKNFLAAPYFIASTTCPKFIMPPLSDDTELGLPNAMDFFARTGMFERFDAAAKRSIEISDANSKDCSNPTAELLANCASILAQHGCPDKARSIYDKLFSVLPTLSLENRMRALAGRASLIEATDGSAAALNDYRQLSQYCSQPGSVPRDFLLDTLQRLVASSVKNKNYEMAETSQLHIVDLEKDQPNRYRHSQYQKLVAALLQLAEIDDLAGNISKSQDALEQARSLYEEKVNSEDQILLERIGSPCLSDVELRMAYSYARSKQFDKALAQADLAGKLVSEALGSESNSAIQIRKISKSLSAQKDDKDQAQLQEMFSSLLEPRTTNDPAVQDASDEQLARQAYDAGHSSEPTAALNKLFQHELSKHTHSADDVTRLIYLITEMQTPLSPRKAASMLRQLDACFDGAGAGLSTNRLYQEAELALLTEGNASQAWTDLDSQLNKIESAHFGNLASNARDADQRKFTWLLRVSNIYAFLDKPKKALRLVQYGLDKYPSVSERDVSPVAYKAILYLMENDMSEAQKQIDILMAPKTDFHYDYSKMLIALSSTLFQTGHSDLSLQLLHLDANPLNANTKKVLAFQRAVIEYRLGKFQDALSDLQESEGAIMRGPISPVFLKVQLLAKTGQTNQAILDLLKLTGIGRTGPMAFTQAVALAKTMDSIPTDTVQALVSALGKLYGPAEVQIAPDLEFVSNLARKHHVSANSLNDLDAHMSYMESARGNSDEALAHSKERAQRLENEHNAGASYEWANLARLYFGQNKFTEGTNYMLHALQPDSAGSFNNWMYHPGNLRGDLGFTVLVKAQQYDDAEKILKRSMVARKSPGQASSGYIEKSLLAELFLEEGKYDEAKKWADALLATFSADDGIASTPGGSMRAFVFFSLVDKFTEKKQYAIAQQLLDQATKVQLELTGTGNALFIENYQSRAKLLAAQNKLSLAEDYARKALDLENWIGGSENSGRISWVVLASILRKEGKDAEADQISVTHLKTERRIQDQSRLYNTHRTFHAPQPDRYAGTAEEPLKQIVAEAKDSHGEGSKSERKAMDELSKFYVQQKRYDEAEKVQLQELHILDQQYRKSSQPKFGCFLNLAEIYLLENKPDQALKFVQPITDPPTYGGVFDQTKSQLRLANVWLSLGKKEQALEWARKVEKDLLARRPHFGDFDQELNDCLSFMEKAGAVEDTDALRKVQNARKGEPREPVE